MATTITAPTASKLATVTTAVAPNNPVVMARVGMPTTAAASASKAIASWYRHVAHSNSRMSDSTSTPVRNARGISTPATASVSKGTSSSMP